MSLENGSIEKLHKALVGPLIKLFAKMYLGEVGAGFVGATSDFIAKKVSDYHDQRELARRLEALSEKVVESLVSVFEDSAEASNAIEPICLQLAPLVEAIATNDYLMGKDLDPQTVLADVRVRFPLPKGHFSETETSLYHRSLDRLVRCIIEIAPSLPKFAVESVRRSLQQFSAFVDAFDKVADRIERIEDAIRYYFARSSGDSEAYGRFEIDYRLAIARQADYLELFGADIAPEAKRHELSIAYVTLSLDTRASANRSEYSSFDSALARIAAQKRRCLLVRGEAGSGKSTLFRWAALQAGGAADVDRRREGSPTTTAQALDSPNQSLPWQGHVPFLIRLRDFQGGLPPAQELARHSVQTLGVEPPGWTLAQLAAGRAIVMLDGVDEVPNFQRERVAKQIVDLVEQYPGNIYLVSTRPTAVPPLWLHSAGFIESAVNPLGERDKFELIDNWHRAVAKSGAFSDGWEDKLAAQAEALRALIRDNVSLSRLATNPLLCAMICALHHGRSGDVPESPSLLCEALCQMLLHRREAEADIDMSKFPPEYRSLTYSQKRMFVKKIAHYMVHNEMSALDAQRADQLVNVALQRMPNAPATDGRTLRIALVERGGILREPQQNRIDFLHNTIKEYLAAEQFVDDGDSGALSARAFEPTWWPVITFAAATTNANFSTELIRQILAKADQKGLSETQRTGRLLAVRCAASALELDADLRGSLETLTKRLFPPKNMAEAESLAFGGDDVVPQLVYKDKRKAREAAACVRALRLIGTTRAQAAIRDYLHDSRMTVIMEVIQDTDPLSAPLILSKVLGGEFLDWDVLQRISSLDQLRDQKVTSSLYLPSIRVPNLESLASLQGLESLNLSHGHVRDWSALQKLQSIKTLQLTRSNISDSDLRYVSGSKSLLNLYLTNTLVTSLSEIEAPPPLQVLNVDGTQIESGRDVGRFDQLRSLSLGGRAFASLEGIEKLQSLRSLRITSSPNISSLKPIAALTALEEFALIRPNRDIDIAPIFERKKLHRLVLRIPASQHDILEGDFGSLVELDIDARATTSFAKAQNFNSLEKLILLNLRTTSLEGISFPKLKVLAISSETLKSFDGIENLKHLEVLRIGVPLDTDFSAIARCPKLRRIEIGMFASYPTLHTMLKALPHVTLAQTHEDVTVGGVVTRNHGQIVMGTARSR